MDRGGRRIGWERAEAFYDLAAAARPYLFETLPADLYPRLDREGAAFTLHSKADLVFHRFEFRLAPGGGARRELVWTLRRGLAGGVGAEVAAGRESFEPSLFDLAGPGGTLRTASLRRALNLAHAKAEGAALLRGRLRPVTPEFRPALPRLSLPLSLLDADLFSAALTTGVTLHAASGGRAVPLALSGAHTPERVTLRLEDPEGVGFAATFVLTFPHSEASMVAATRERDLADATVMMVAEYARLVHRDRLFTIAPPAADPIAREELALFDGWLGAAAATFADPDLAAYDRARRDPHGG